MSGSARNTPTRPSIREQIAAKRAEVRNTPVRAGLGASGSGGPGASPLAPRRAPVQATSRSSTAGSVFQTPARRTAGARGAAGSAAFGQEVVDDKNVYGEIAKAVKSGKLDISSLSLNQIPPELYTKLLGIPVEDLSNPPPKSPPPLSDIPSTPGKLGSGWDSSDLSSAGLSREEERALVFGAKAAAAVEAKANLDRIWAEPEELTVLKVGFNRIESLEKEIGMFGGLRTLDLSHNRLKVVPDNFADLLKLTTLDLSNNAISSLPQSILLLPLLQVLDLSHNSLSTLSFDSPIKPSEDGLGYGVGFFTSAFARAEELKADRPIWPTLRSLNMGHNRLSNEAVAALGKNRLSSMRVLNLEHNALQGELDADRLGLGEKDMPILATLVLSGNNNLRGITGVLGRDARVETVGCNLRQGTAEPADPVTSASTTETSTAEEAKDIDGGGSNGIPSPDMTVVYRTLPAATFDSDPLNVDFDLYLPPDSVASSLNSGNKGHPVVIWFHGGGLLQGNKENLPPHFRRLPAQPLVEGGEHVAVISPNYRLSPQVPILDILGDITALVNHVQTKLNERLAKAGRSNRIDASRICLSGGSAGGYLALIAGLEVPRDVEDEDVGGYRGLQSNAIKCLAPFYPITDLTDEFWATKTDPVPWMTRSVPHAEAKPHIDTKAAPVCTAVSGGPRSILYPYMLQHGLFPSLLFLNQRSLGKGLDGFRPSPKSLSIPHRLHLVQQIKDGLYPVSFERRKEKNPPPTQPVPIYFIYGTADDKVQPQAPTIEALKQAGGELEVEVRQGQDHAFDEDPQEECQAFKEWLGKHLL